MPVRIKLLCVVLLQLHYQEILQVLAMELGLLLVELVVLLFLLRTQQQLLTEQSALLIPCAGLSTMLLVLLVATMCVITFNANPSVANAGTDQTSLCGVTSTALSGNTPSVGTGAWSIVSGIGGSFVATSNPTTTFNGVVGNSYILRWTISNAPCAASSDDVLITFNANPSVANAGVDQTSLCGVTSTALSGNTPSVGTGAWSIVSGIGGSFVSNSNPTTTFNGTIGTTLYLLRWTINNAPCAASSDDVVITFNTNPSVANAGADQTSLCGVTSTALSGNTPSVGTGAWSIVSGVGGSFVSTSNPTTTFNGVVGNSYVLRWTISNAPCTASSDDVLITFNANPSVANAGADQTSLCGVASTSLTGNTPSDGTGAWSIVSGIGGSFVAATSPTTTFNGVVGNSYILRWTISNAPCAASSDDVLITFNANPSVANAGADQTSLCGVTSTALLGNTPGVGTGAWSIVSGIGGSFVATSNPTTTFNGIIGTTYTLRWTISNAPCAASSDDVLITFNANPSVANAGTDQTSLCGVTSTALSGNTPSVGTGAWSIVSGVGGSFVAATNPTTTFNGVVGNSYILRWTINNAPCAASSDDVLITFNANPSVANAGADQTSLCGVASTSLSGNTPSVGTGAWSIVSGVGGSFVSTSNPTTTFNGTIGTTYTLRWTINNTPCAASSDDVVITFNSNPSVANAGADQTSLCGVTSTSLSGNTPSVGTGTWSIVSGIGGSFVAATNPTTTFNGVVGNSYVLRWTISNAPCTASSDDVLITFNANPSVANAGADQTSLCGVTSTALSGNTPSVGTGTWSIVSGVGGSFVAATNPTTTFNGVVGNSYVLRWTISNAPCTASSDDVLITFNANPSVANAGADQTSLCGVASTALSGNTPGVGTGAWSIVSGVGGSFVSTSNPTTTFNGVLGNSYVLRWTISNAPCTASNDDVLITFNANPSVANAGADQTSLCGVASTALSGNTPSVGTGAWSIVSGVGGSFVAATNPTTTFNGVVGNSYVLRWTISNAPCTASNDDVLITFNANPSVANAGADQTSLCGVASTALSGNTPSVGTGAWSIVSGVGGSFVAATNPTTTFNGVVGNSYILRWTINNAPCAASSDDVLITFNANPSVANAGIDQISALTCGLTSVTLSGNTPVTGNGLWTIISGGIGSFSNASQANSLFSAAPGVLYTLKWTISNGCGANTDTVLIKLNANPTTALAGADQTIACDATSTLLAANSPIFGIGTWSIVSGLGGSVQSPNSPISSFAGTLSNAANVSYTLRWTITNAPCVSSSDDVVITFPRTANIADAGTDILACGTTSTTLNAGTPGAAHTGVWTLISGTPVGSFSNPTSRNSTFTGSPGAIYVLRWTITRTATGCTSFDEVTVSFPLNPITANAGSDQLSICGANSLTLSANGPGLGTGQWSIISGLGGVFSNSNDPSALFTGVVGATYTLRWTISSAICGSTFDEVSIAFNSNSTPANAGNDQLSLCGVNSTFLTANTPISGVGNWAIVGGVGGFVNSTNDPQSQFTGILGNTYTLEWSIQNPPCVASKDTVIITFNGLPTSSIAGPNQTICGNSVVMSANTPIFGNGLWSVISGSAVFANPTSPVSAVSGLGLGINTLRWEISTPNCGSSFSDLSITVTSIPAVANAGPDQTSLCGISSTTLAANTPNIGLATWTVVSGSGGTFQDINNPTTTFNGLLGNSYVLRWTISNPPCADSFDDVIVTFHDLPSIAQAGVDQTICSSNTSLAATTPLVGNGIWQVIAGTSTVANPANPLSAVSSLSLGNNQFVWTVSNGTCAPSSDTVSVFVETPASVAQAGVDQTICSSNTSLAATTPLVGSGNWQVIAGSSTVANPSNPLSAVSNLSLGNNTFVWTVSNGTCAPSRDTITVFVETPASVAQAGVDQTICSSNTSLAATTPLVGSGNWQVIAGTSTVANPANPLSAVSSLSLGNNQFVWTVSNGTCAPSRDTITVFVDTPASIAQAGVDQTICASNTSLGATTPLVGSGNWQVIAGSSTVANPANPLSTVSSLSLGNNTFVWTVSNGTCAPSSDTVSVFVNSPASVAQAGVDQTICSTNTSLTATTPLVGSGSWQVIAGSSTVANTTNPLSTVSNLSLGNNTFVWTVSNGACTPSSDTITVFVETPASIAQAGVDQTICASNTSLTATIPLVGNGSWQVIAGSSTVANPVNPLSAVSGLSLGNNTFVWTVSNGTCAPSSDTVSVFVDTPASIAQAGVDQTICSSNTSLAATTPLIGNGSWQVIAGSSTVANPANPLSTVSSLSLGNNTFVWTVSNGTCTPSNDTVTVFVNSPVSVAQAGVDQTICSSNTSLTATTPIVGSGNWQVIAGSSTVANTTNPLSTVSNLSLGNNSFVWTVSNGTCAPSSDTVTVFVDTPASVAQAGVDQTICSSNTSLTASTPIVGSGNWQVIAGSSTVANTANPLSTVSNLSLGNNSFVWTVSNGTCAPSSDTVTVLVDTPASIAQAGVDQTTCSSNTNLAAATPLVGSGNWQVISGSSTVANSANPLSAVSNLSLGNNTFVWTVSNGTCAPSSDTVSVFVNSPASVAQAGVDQTICSTNTSLTATTPMVGSGSWQVIAGTSTVANPTNPLSTVSNLSFGNNTFVWTVSNGTCAPSSDTVTVFVDESPSPAFAGFNQTICASTTILAATVPLVGSGNWTVVSGTGVFANAGDAATSVSGIINDTNIYRWTVGNGICPSVFSDVMITVASNPPVADAGPNDTICGNSTTLSGNISTVGIGTWTLVSGSGNFVNANSATTLVNNLGSGDNIFRWTLNNPPCTPTFDDVTIHVTSIPAIADAGRDTTICSVDSIALNGNNLVSQSKKWTILSGGGGSFTSGIDTLANSVFHGILDSTYVLRWTLSNPPCADSFDDVVITFLRAPSTSIAGNDQTGISTCGLTSLSLAANTPNSGVGTWSVQSGAGGTIQSTSSPNSLFTGVSGSTYLLTWTIANTCGSSQSDVLITFNQNPDTALAGNDSTICASTIQLGANIPSLGTGFWKSISGTGIFSDTLLPNSTISSLSAGIHTLVWEIRTTICGSSYDTLTIQVDSLPTFLYAGNDQTICDSTSTVALNATAASIGNSFWSIISGSGTFQNPTLFNSTVNQLTNGINLLAWNVNNGVCPTITDTLVVMVDTPPSAANAGNNRIVCTNFVVLKADSITSGTGLWTQTLGTGANISQPNNDTTLVNQLQLGLNSFTWTVSNGVCPSNSDTVYVDVNQASSAAVAGADTTICESTDSISIHALAPIIGIGSWKVLIGPSIISDTLQASTYIKGLQKGLNKIVWTVRNGLCSDFDVVNILVDSLPTPAIAGVIPPVCETSTSVLLSANQAITGVGQWTSASGIPVFADTNLATSTVTNLQIGSNLLFWTISNGACQGVSSSVLVHVDQLPDSAKAGLDIRSCEGFSQLTLAADSPLVGIGYWTRLSGPLNILDTANAHTALTGAAFAPYSSSFSWTTSNGVCPLMVDTVNVLVDAYPSSSFAGINDTICSTNIQLNASPALVGLGQWTSLSGTIQFADSNLATTNANGLSTGSNTLYWTVSNGVCADSVSSVIVFVDVAPSIALAGVDISECENTSGISLNAILPSIGSGTWTVLSGSFQLVNSNQANSALQNIGAGNSIFVWSVVNGTCPSSSDTVSVTVSALPSSAVVGANQLLCENASLVNVSAVAPTSGIGSWTVIQGGGAILSPTSATTQVTFNPGVNSYAYTVTNGTCPSSIDTAYVTVDSISAPAFAGNDLAICENTTAVSLNATFVNYGLAQWTSLTPGISIVNPTQNNTAISGVALGINQLVWTSTNGVCPANSDTVEIIVSALPSSATAGTNQNWCDTITQIQLQGNIPQVGSGVWIPVSGGGTISTPSSASTTVSGLQVGSAVFEWVISSGACTASRDSVSITINASPTPSIAGINQSYCINSNAITLNGNVPTIGSGTWSLLSGNATIDNVSQANSGIQVSDSGNYVFNWTITNGVCQSTSSTEIHIDALPSSANAGADITANTPVVFLNAEIPQIGTGTWLLFQGVGTILDINNPATQVSGLGQGTSILSWTVSNGVCAYSADEITISYLDLAIPNAISPNNDGINDAFVIPGLEYYSNVKFTLFNSWGTIVYESNDYKNDFAGLTESGQRLIDDTYYYVLQISSDLEYKGYLILKK
jgi:gliding motility-associated-like protein